jgi:hypothetical protein
MTKLWRLLADVLLWLKSAFRSPKTSEPIRPTRVEKRSFSESARSEPFVRVTSSATAMRAAVITLQPLFEYPHEKVNPVQKAIVNALFGLFGSKYIPGRLLGLLSQVDAFEATRLFLQHIGIEFDELCRPGADREYLQYALGVLAEVDVARHRSGLADAPFYEALRSRDIAQVEALADQLSRADRILTVIRRTRPLFPRHSQFIEHAARKLERWNQVSVDVLEDFFETGNLWRALETEFESLRTRITDRVAELASYAYEDKELAAALPGIIHRLRSIADSATDGTMEASEAIEGLTDLCDKLDILSSEYESDFEVEPELFESGEAQVRNHLSTLGLLYPDDLNSSAIKKAFRRKALESHSDVGGSDEAMRILIAAKDFLLDYLEAMVKT